MDLRGRTVGSSTPTEVGNPAVLFKGLEDVPKRSVKPKGSQEPLITDTANVNPPSGETKAQRSQRKINEAMEIAKNNNADDLELIRTYRKAVSDANAEESPEIHHQVLTTSSSRVEQTMEPSQSSLEEGQIRETLPINNNNTVIQSPIDTMNPIPEINSRGREEGSQPVVNQSLGLTTGPTGIQNNPVSYPRSSQDSEFMNSMSPEKQRALITAENVIQRTIREVEEGHRPLTALRVAQHGANIIDYAHNFNVETIVRDAMVRHNVPILTQEQMSRVDGRPDPNQLVSRESVSNTSQQGN